MEYTYFNKITERISVIEKYQKFKEDEPVRCTEMQYDEEGFLEKDSLLIVQDTLLTSNGIKKTKKCENLVEDDIEYMCYHIETGKHFWIKGSQLKKAVDEEAENILNRYHKKCFGKEMCKNLVGGLLCILLMLSCVAGAIFIAEKLLSVDLYDIYFISLFITTIVGFVFIIIVCISSYYDYVKKTDKG